MGAPGGGRESEGCTTVLTFFATSPIVWCCCFVWSHSSKTPMNSSSSMRTELYACKVYYIIIHVKILLTGRAPGEFVLDYTVGIFWVIRFFSNICQAYKFLTCHESMLMNIWILKLKPVHTLSRRDLYFLFYRLIFNNFSFIFPLFWVSLAEIFITSFHCHYVDTKVTNPASKVLLEINLLFATSSVTLLSGWLTISPIINVCTFFVVVQIQIWVD